jgi:adenylate kinase
MLGAPGSGKGTQALRLGRKLGVPAISTGEMLRQAVVADSELGRQVSDVLAGGRLVADELMVGVVRARLAQSDASAGFLLDGYPRNLRQADTLHALLDELGEHLDAVIFLRVPEDVLVRRALLRRRADDREEVVRERLRIYRDQTEPVIGYYRQRGLLQEIDGDRGIDEVTSEALAAVSNGRAA